MAPLITATFPLHSCRMTFSLHHGNRAFRWSDTAIHGDGAGLRTAVKTDAAPGAVLAGVMRRMHSVGAQLGQKLQALGRARFHAQPAAFTFLFANDDVTPGFSGHSYSLATSAAARFSHLVRSQYSYS